MMKMTKSEQTEQAMMAHLLQIGADQDLDLLMVDWAVSSDDTEYVCKAFKLPEVDSTQHIVKIEPIVQAGNEGTVHHVLMYVCPEFLVANGSDFSNSQLECEEYEE